MKKRIKFLFLIALVFILMSACAARRSPLQCNTYVINQMSKQRVYLPQANANGLDNYMSKSSNWKKIPRLSNKKLNHKEAHKLVRAGKIVIVTYNTHSKRSGHIALLAGKRFMYWSQGFKADVPYVDGSLNGKPASITPLSHQFSPNKEPNMNYFVYAKR
ncbi:MAG: hypothetical protein LBN20_00855 [Endomicrobium sp.]|jgi:hypothetical protein|nr:hypothetical protein [Endomicrobium sp.]